MGVNGIYGLSGSGLDVESMVKVGMMSKQNELEKMQQKYTLNEWKKTEYLDLYSEVQTFNNSTLSQYKLSSTMNARSASSSNEAAVTATANGNAAPMQHYVEVGQLASAAYLIGTQSVTRLDGSTSTELQNALFKSLEKDGDTYTFVDSSGNTTTGLSASDIAFTFRIGDGTQTTANLLTTNDDIFTASMQSGHAASDTSSHTVKVDLADPPVMTTSGVSITSSTAMSSVFKTLLNDSNDSYITQRLNRLANDTDIKNKTAFTINFYDQNSTTNIGSVSFAYSDLTSSNSFYTHIQNQLSSADITVSLNTDGSLSFTNANATGSDSYIQFSLDASNFDLGFNEADTDTQNLSMYPLASSTGLNLTTDTTSKAAFAQLLSGSTSYNSISHTGPIKYIEAHSDSSEIALTFTVTDENNRTNSIDVAFSDMAKTDVTFLNFINSKLDGVFEANGGKTTGGEAKIEILSNGQLKITDGEYGSSNTLTASVALDKIGKTGYKYPLSNPADVTLTNQSISDFVNSKFGMNTDAQNKYIATLKNNGSDPATTTAFTLQIADGSNTTTINIAASDLTDSRVKLWSKIQANLTTDNKITANITAGIDNNTITFSNSEIGSGNKIDISFVGSATLETQALATSGIDVSSTTLAGLLGIDFNDNNFKNNNATSSTASDDAVFALTYNYGTSSTTGTVYINYQDLNTNLITLLNNKLLGTNLTAMFGYTDTGDSKQIILVNTTTGSTSTINSLSWKSNIANNIGKYPDDVSSNVTSTETVKGFLHISDTDIFKDLASNPSISGTTAISVTFNDGSNTAITKNITWKDIADKSDTAITDLLNFASGTQGNITATVSGNTITFSNPNIYDNAQITITTTGSSISDSYTFPPIALNLDNYFSTDYTPSNGYATLTFTNTETVKSALNITASDTYKIDALSTNTNEAYSYTIGGTKFSVTWQDLIGSSDSSVSSVLYDKWQATANGTNITSGTNTITVANTPPPTVTSSTGTTSVTVNGSTYSINSGVNLIPGFYSTSTALASTTIKFENTDSTVSSTFNINSTIVNAISNTTESDTTAFTINVSDKSVNFTWGDLASYSDNTVVELLKSKLINATDTNIAVSTDTNSVTFTNSTPITSSTTASTATISYTVDVSNLATTLFGVASSPATQATLTESDVTSLFSTTYNCGTYTKSGAIVNSTTGISPTGSDTLINNLDNLFKQTRAGDDGSGDVANNPNYTQATLIDKIGKFFGGNAYDSDNNKAFVSGQSGSITIDGTSYALNRAESNTYTASDGIIYTLNSDGEALSNITDSGETISVTYAQLASGYTFNDLVSEINSLGLNVRATYDSVQDRFSIYNKESGAENSIIIGFDIYSTDTTVNSAIDRTAAFFQNMGLRQTENGVLDTEAGTGGSTTDIDFEFEAGKTSILTGKNAIAKIDGIDYNDLSKNNVTVNGVTYNFNAVTNTDIDTTTSTINSSSDVSKVAVTVTQDTAAIASKVKSFVEEYNTILAKLYEWYDEKPNANYKPLTASQKEGMKDEQIEKWEEKAKAGMLYHDKTLFTIINQMRSVISEKIEGVTGNYNTIFSLGVSTTGTKGQLKLDEDKLNAALANDPDAVYNIFSKLDKGETQYYVKVGNNYIWTTNQSAGELQYDKDGNPRTKTVERSSYNGIAQRLSDILNTGMKSLKTVAGSSGEITEDSDLNNLLRDLQTKMSNFQRMMQAFETRLYKKYDAMESALALLGAQLNYVTGAFQ